MRGVLCVVELLEGFIDQADAAKLDPSCLRAGETPAVRDALNSYLGGSMPLPAELY